MAQLSQSARSRTRQARVHKETHGGSGWERVVLLLFDQLPGKSQSSADVLDGHVVFSRHILKTHPGSKTPHNNCHWRSCAPDDRFPVADIWVDYDSIIHPPRMLCDVV